MKFLKSLCPLLFSYSRHSSRLFSSCHVHTNQTLVPRPAAELVTRKPMQRAMLTNANNLSVASRWPIERPRSPLSLWIDHRSRQYWGKEGKSLCIFNLPISETTLCHRGFHKFDDRKGKTREHVVHFLDSMEPLPMLGEEVFSSELETTATQWLKKC